MKKVFFSNIVLCLTTVVVLAQKNSLDEIAKNGFIYYKDGQPQNAQKIVNFILEKRPDYPDAVILKRILQKKSISDLELTPLTAKFHFIETLSKVSVDTTKFEMKGLLELETTLKRWQQLNPKDKELSNATVAVSNLKGISENLTLIRNHPSEYKFSKPEKIEVLEDIQNQKDFWKPKSNPETIATNNLVVVGQELHEEGKCRNSLQVIDLVLSIDPKNVDALTKKALIMSDWGLKKTDLQLLCDAFPKADAESKVLIFGNLLYGYKVDFDRNAVKYKGIDVAKKILGLWVDHERVNNFNSAELQSANDYVRSIVNMQSEFEALLKGGKITKTATGVVVEKGDTTTEYSFDFIEASASKAVAMFNKHTPVCVEASTELEAKEKLITWSQIDQSLKKILK